MKMDFETNGRGEQKQKDLECLVKGGIRKEVDQFKMLTSEIHARYTDADMHYCIAEVCGSLDLRDFIIEAVNEKLSKLRGE